MKKQQAQQYKKFDHGQLVIDNHGMIVKVLQQVGCRVYITGGCVGKWMHPSKLWAKLTPKQ
jgi:dephospho-CoA kinase